MMPIIRVSLVFSVLVLAGCGMQVSSTFQRVSSSDEPSSSAAATATNGGAVEWFGEVSGWTIVDDPATAADFEEAANVSVAGIGFARVQAAGTATRDANGDVVTILAFAIAPDAGNDEMELFGAILDGMQAGMGVESEPAIDGQAFTLLTGELQVIVGPWAGGPHTLFLYVDGPSDGAAEEIYSIIVNAGPGGAGS